MNQLLPILQVLWDWTISWLWGEQTETKDLLLDPHHLWSCLPQLLPLVNFNLTPEKVQSLQDFLIAVPMPLWSVILKAALLHQQTKNLLKSNSVWNRNSINVIFFSMVSKQFMICSSGWWTIICSMLEFCIKAWNILLDMLSYCSAFQKMEPYQERNLVFRCQRNLYVDDYLWVLIFTREEFLQHLSLLHSN